MKILIKMKWSHVNNFLQKEQKSPFIIAVIQKSIAAAMKI